MRAKREMPQKGFYVIKPTAYPELTAKGYIEAVYTTGVRGGGGHKSCRRWGTCFNGREDNSPLAWHTRLWSCVPAKKEMEDKWNYYANWEDIPKELGIPQLPQ